VDSVPCNEARTPGSNPVGAIFRFPSPCLQLWPLAALNSGRLAIWPWKIPPRREPAVAGDGIDHVRASSLVERFVASGRCLQLGPLAAFNCGRLATWSRKNCAAGDRDFCVDSEVEGRRGAEHHAKERVAQLHLARRGRRLADGERSMLWTSTDLVL
jgi:hypothetical protein